MGIFRRWFFFFLHLIYACRFGITYLWKAYGGEGGTAARGGRVKLVWNQSARTTTERNDAWESMGIRDDGSSSNDVISIGMCVRATTTTSIGNYLWRSIINECVSSAERTRRIGGGGVTFTVWPWRETRNDVRYAGGRGGRRGATARWYGDGGFANVVGRL